MKKSVIHNLCGQGGSGAESSSFSSRSYSNKRTHQHNRVSELSMEISTYILLRLMNELPIYVVGVLGLEFFLHVHSHEVEKATDEYESLFRKLSL